MKEFEIVVNEETEIISVNDFFTFSIKYHNLSSISDTITESEKIIVRWSTTGIWLIDDDELLIKEDGDWKDVSEEFSFFLDWHNPDSAHCSISLRMLFNAVVDGLKYNKWKTFGSFHEHSIRIIEIAQHYREKIIQEEQENIQEKLKEILLKESFRDLVEFTRNKSNCKSIDKIRKGFEALDRLNNLKPKIPQDSQFIKDKKKQITKVPALDSSFNKKKLAKKKWSELPNSVKVELLFEYEIPEEEMEKYWNGTDYIQREVYILKDLKTLSKILCKWKQDSVVSLFLYLNSVFKHKHKLIHNQAPV